MKRLFVFMLPPFAASASPALADEAPWYVGVDVGAAFLDRSQITPTGGFGYVPGPQVETSVKASTAFEIGAVIGHQFNHFRIEAEVANKSASNKNYTSAGFSAYPTATPPGFGIILPGSYSSVTGRQNVLSVMGNGMVDLGKPGGVRFSLGGGLGVARVQDSLGINGFGAVLRDSHTGFAWQLIAGARVPVGRKVELGVKYRFFNANHIDLSTLVGTTIRTKYRSNSVLVGLTYKFGHSN